MAEQAYRMAERQCRDASNVRTYRQVFGGQPVSAAAVAAGSGTGGEFLFILILFSIFYDDTCRFLVRATHCAIEHMPAVGDIFFIDLITSI